MAESATAAGGWTTLQQLGVQIAAVLDAVVYDAVVTYILLLILSKFVGLRAPPDMESAGLDSGYHGQHGYGMLNLN